MAAQRLWTRDFILALAIASFLSFVFYLLITTMAEYAVRQFGASETLGGLAASAFIGGAMIARILTGAFLDVIGRFRILTLGLGASVLITLLYIPVDSLWLLIVVRVLHGLTFGAGHTAIMASAQAIIPAERRAEGTGYFSTSTTLAAALGPFLALLLIAEYGYAHLFMASAAFTIVGFVGILFLRIPDARPTGEPVGLRSLRPSTFIDSRGLPIGAIMFLAGVGYSSVMAFMAGYTSDLGMADAAPTFFMAFAIVSLICRLTLGRVQDRLGDNVVVYPLFAAFVASLAFVAAAQAPWMIVVAGMLAGAGFGSLVAAAQAITVRAAGPARIGVATSTYFLLMDLGFGVGPVVLGQIVALQSYRTMYWAATAAVLIAAVLYHVFHGRSGGRMRSL